MRTIAAADVNPLPDTFSRRQRHCCRSTAVRPIWARFAIPFLAWIAACAVIGGQAALAQIGSGGTTSAPGATTYSTTRRTFNVGILLVDSTAITDGKGDENPDPYVFYIGDSRLDLKPANWEFVNPLAPATVTDTIKARWDARMNGNSGYQIGQKVTKNMACYWEVPLTNTSITDLLQFDMLFITNHRTTTFTPADREKLRKVVDGGGVVWLEDCGGMTIGGGLDTTGNSAPLGSFFLNEVQFYGTQIGDFVNSGPAVFVPNHPILNSPYVLSLQEIANLGDKNYGNFCIGKYDDNAAGTAAMGAGDNVAPNPETLINIVGNTGALDNSNPPKALPYIAAGYYGSGSVLLTSGDSGCDINDYVGGTNAGSGGNSGAYCGTNLQAAHAEDLKFLYNIVSWGSSNTSYRRNDRRSGASYETMGAPLLPQFNFASLYRTADRVTSTSAPLMVNGLMYVSGINSAGNVTVRSYDTQPFRDYDGDGNYDDGLPDVSLGLQYDEIMRYNGGAAGGPEQPSSPIFATINVGATQFPNGGTKLSGTPTNELFVTEPSGQLDILAATPILINGTSTAAVTGATPGIGLSLAPAQPGGYPIPVPADKGSGIYDATAGTNFPPTTHGVAPAPAVYGNLVFQVEPDGLVRCIDATTGAIQWNSFDITGAAPVTMSPAGTPTLGFTENTSNTQAGNNSNHNTNDLMLYVPMQMQQSANSTTNIGQVLAYWLGTRNEAVRNFSNDAIGQAQQLKTRAYNGPLNIAGGFPFTPPLVRGVYSPTYDPATGLQTVSVEDNYANNVQSPYYTAGFVSPTAGQPNGLILVSVLPSAPNGTKVPGPGTGQENNIIVAVDYNVEYLNPNTTANQLTLYNNSLQKIGVIPNSNLTITNYTPQATVANSVPIPGGGLDTATFSPDDLLTFTADQSATVAGGAAGSTLPVSSIFGVHPQPDQSSTLLTWRFALYPPAQADGTVNGQTIVDNAPIFNYMKFTSFNNTSMAGQILQVNVNGTLQNEPEYLSGLKVIGPPITTNNGLTYVLASGVSAQNAGPDNPYPLGNNQPQGGGAMTVLMAFTANPTITLTLPVPFDPTYGAQVTQENALNPGTTVTAAVTPQNSSILLDATRGRLTISNFNGTGGQLSASQSFVVQVTPVNQTTPVTFVVHPLPQGVTNSYVNTPTNPTVPSTESGGFTPLQWYYVLPGQPLSAPTLIGDYIFYTSLLHDPSVADPTPHMYVIAVDANAPANDSAVRVGFGEPVQNVVGQLTTQNGTVATSVNHVHWIQQLPDDTTGTVSYTYAFAPPVGSQGTLAVNSNHGTFAFQDAQTLVADGKRILEVGPDGTATWALNSSQLSEVVGGDLPIFGTTITGGNSTTTVLNGNPTGSTQIISRALNHPSVVRKIASSDYLIADTGNNRVLRVDRGGSIIWKLDTLSNDYNVLAGGDPISLSGPTDVQEYVAPTVSNAAIGPGGVVTGGTVTGYEVHYVVADPGNFRIVEVADYYNSKGQPANAPGTTISTAGKHEVVWVTRTQSVQGRSLRYTAIQRYLGIDPTGTYSGYPYIIATVSNSTVGGTVGSTTSDSTGGALVSVNYSPYNTALPVNNATSGTQAVLEPWAPTPATPQLAIPTEPVGDGTILAAANDLRETTGTASVGFGSSGASTPTAGNTASFLIRRLQRPTSFTELNLPNNTTGTPAPGAATIRTVYLICDIGAVYAVEATSDSTTPTPNSVRNVLWKFTQSDYDVMNYARFTAAGIPPALITPDQLPRFSPSSLQLLSNGDFLISNAYYGPNSLFQSGKFNGEVFQVTPNANPGSLTNGYVPASGAFSLYTAASSTFTAEGGTWDSFSVPQLAPVPTVPPTLPTLMLQQMGASSNTNLLEQPLFANRP